jgi:hypothetical protein
MSPRRLVFLTASLAAVFVAAAVADDPKPVDVGGLTFQAPPSWSQVPPTSSMRKAQLAIKPVAPDTEPAEMVLFVFPGGAGTVEANVTRWRNQFEGPSGEPPALASKTLKVAGLDVTRVEVAGTYTDPFSKKGSQKGYRLIAAIVETGQSGYYFKLTGPDKTVTAAAPEFDKLIASIKAGK